VDSAPHVVRHGIPFRAAADRPYLHPTADFTHDDAESGLRAVLRQFTDAWSGLVGCSPCEGASRSGGPRQKVRLITQLG